ncbi:hypothetical protein HK407_05g08820 [Ordospora pajunii]|uniref:uncharacterized protein n=1 Tax=Ordospora pajunii TaxID=3039483 RepID=UPI0029527598|nr:uncharacterized protein HK407_05g08820 [Ordospora pajunii]KAH9411506.1 hypothetical protein HK407_05g08820 [Ordospora pajunii]
MDQAMTSVSKQGVKGLRRSTRSKTQAIFMDAVHEECATGAADMPIIEKCGKSEIVASTGIVNGHDVLTAEKRMFSFNSLIQMFSGMEKCIHSEGVGSVQKHEDIPGILANGCVKHLLRVLEDSACKDRVNGEQAPVQMK